MSTYFSSGLEKNTRTQASSCDRKIHSTRSEQFTTRIKTQKQSSRRQHSSRTIVHWRTSKSHSSTSWLSLDVPRGIHACLITFKVHFSELRCARTPRRRNSNRPDYGNPNFVAENWCQYTVVFLVAPLF